MKQNKTYLKSCEAKLLRRAESFQWTPVYEKMFKMNFINYFTAGWLDLKAYNKSAVYNHIAEYNGRVLLYIGSLCPGDALCLRLIKLKEFKVNEVFYRAAHVGFREVINSHIAVSKRMCDIVDYVNEHSNFFGTTFAYVDDKTYDKMLQQNLGYMAHLAYSYGLYIYELPMGRSTLLPIIDNAWH